MNKTLGIKHLPDGTVLRLRLINQHRRVQRRVLGVFWLALPEPLSLREALLWYCHQRLVCNEVLTAYERSVFMLLRPGEQLLPLTHPAAERHIVSLYAAVRGDCWYDEERCKWLPISTFFSDRK